MVLEIIMRNLDFILIVMVNNEKMLYAGEEHDLIYAAEKCRHFHVS